MMRASGARARPPVAASSAARFALCEETRPGVVAEPSPVPVLGAHVGPPSAPSSPPACTSPRGPGPPRGRPRAPRTPSRPRGARRPSRESASAGSRPPRVRPASTGASTGVHRALEHRGDLHADVHDVAREVEPRHAVRGGLVQPSERDDDPAAFSGVLIDRDPRRAARRASARVASPWVARGPRAPATPPGRRGPASTPRDPPRRTRRVSGSPAPARAPA